MGPAGSGGRAGIGMKKLRTVVQIAFMNDAVASKTQFGLEPVS